MSYAAIMFVYNNDPYLERVLDAIQSQTVQPIGIYIVDDASTDRTPDIIKSYGLSSCRLKDTMKKPYERMARAFNVAVTKARQTYPEATFFLKVDGDTLISQDYTERLLPHMSPRIVACSGCSTLYQKTRALNNGAVLYCVHTLPPAKIMYGWDLEIQLTLIRAGYRIHVEPAAKYTDLQPPSVMRPPLTRYMRNRLSWQVANIEGQLRRRGIL